MYLVILDENLPFDRYQMISDYFKANFEWARYFSHVWFLAYKRSQLPVAFPMEKIVSKIDPLVRVGDMTYRFMIWEVDPDRMNGLMPDMVWKWMMNRNYSVFVDDITIDAINEINDDDDNVM